MIAADAVGPEFSDLFESIVVAKGPAVLIGPSLVGALRFPGSHLVIRNTTPVGIFSQSALRYKQAILIDLICTGHSLDLADNLAEKRRKQEAQLPPPLKT